MEQKRDNWVWSVLITVGFISVICGSLWSLNDFIDRENGDLIRLAGSAYLLGSMCIIAIAGRLLFKANAVWLLCFISLPLGLLWSANELLTTLSYVADPSHLPFIATNVMLPTFISGLVCALAFFLMSEDEESETGGSANTVKIFGFIAVPIMIFIGLYLSGFWYPDFLFAEINVFLIVLGCLLMGIARNGRNAQKQISQFGSVEYGFALLDGGKVATFIGAAAVTVFYIALSRLNDPKALGPLLVLGLCTLLWGTFFYLLGVMVSSIVSSPETKRNLRLDAWHLAEAYAFVILALFAPMSFFEMM